MGKDEIGALTAVRKLRTEIIEPKVTEHQGRLFKTMGDGFLIEYPSVVKAVECAAAIQKSIAALNADVSASPRLQLRIGVNLGDVIVEDNDMFGDGVNVAARIEPLSEPGGIAVSGIVYESLGSRIGISFINAGIHNLKNIAKPIQVWRWTPEGIATNVILESTKSDPTLPERPSIAVLPFTNMSGDPEQEFFADGITEDIITELARFNSLFIIARNSSFHYKNQGPRVQDVGRELGVHYVVEGSVRKSGSRVRITAQLVEASTGNHVWAERYDRSLDDLFSLQDEVVREIATAVPGALDARAIQEMHRRSGDNPSTYESLLRAIQLRRQNWGSTEAAKILEAVIAIDPKCAYAYAHLANWHAYSILAHNVTFEDARSRTLAYARKAEELAPNDSTTLSVIAEAYNILGEFASTRRCIERAIKNNPNSYIVMSFAGLIYASLGDTEEALKWNELLLRHDPVSIGAYREAAIEIYYMAERFEDAVQCFQSWQNPPEHMLVRAAAAFAQTGRISEAERLRQDFESRSKGVGAFTNQVEALMRVCALQKHRDLWLDGFRKAGFDC
jgi:TolB-like protein